MYTYFNLNNNGLLTDDIKLTHINLNEIMIYMYFIPFLVGNDKRMEPILVTLIKSSL